MWLAPRQYSVARPSCGQVRHCRADIVRSILASAVSEGDWGLVMRHARSPGMETCHKVGILCHLRRAHCSAASRACGGATTSLVKHDAARPRTGAFVCGKDSPEHLRFTCGSLGELWCYIGLGRGF